MLLLIFMILIDIEHYVISKVKLATLVKGDPRAPFSIATTPRRRGALLYSLDCSTLHLIRPL